MKSYLPIYISLFSVLLPLFFWLSKKPLLKSQLLNSIGTLLIIAALSDVTNYIVVKAGTSNVAIVNFYFITEFLVITTIYSNLLKHRRKIFFVTAVAFVCYSIIITAFYQGMTTPQSWIWTVRTALIIIYCIFHFSHIVKNPPEENIFGYGPMWLNIAFMTYFFFNLVLFTLSNYILTQLPPQDALLLWNIHNCNNILKNILLAFSIYRIHKHISIKRAYYKRFGIDENMLVQQV